MRVDVGAGLMEFAVERGECTAISKVLINFQCDFERPDPQFTHSIHSIHALVDEMGKLLAPPPAPVKRPIGFVHPKDSKDAGGKAAKGRKA